MNQLTIAVMLLALATCVTVSGFFIKRISDSIIFFTVITFLTGFYLLEARANFFDIYAFLFEIIFTLVILYFLLVQKITNSQFFEYGNPEKFKGFLVKRDLYKGRYIVLYSIPYAVFFLILSLSLLKYYIL